MIVNHALVAGQGMRATINCWLQDVNLFEAPGRRRSREASVWFHGGAIMPVVENVQWVQQQSDGPRA